MLPKLFCGFHFHKNQKGEIATIVTLVTLGVIGVTALVSSLISKNTPQTIKSKAQETVYDHTFTGASVMCPWAGEANIEEAARQYSFTPCPQELDGQYCAVCAGNQANCNPNEASVAFIWQCHEYPNSETGPGNYQWDPKNAPGQGYAASGQCEAFCKSGTGCRLDIQCDDPKGCGGACKNSLNKGCYWGGCQAWEMCSGTDENDEGTCLWQESPGYDKSKSCEELEKIPGMLKPKPTCPPAAKLPVASPTAVKRAGSVSGTDCSQIADAITKVTVQNVGGQAKFSLYGDFTNHNDCLQQFNGKGEGIYPIEVYRYLDGKMQYQIFAYHQIGKITNNIIEYMSPPAYEDGTWEVSVSYCNAEAIGGKCESTRKIVERVDIQGLAKPPAVTSVPPVGAPPEAKPTASAAGIDCETVADNVTGVTAKEIDGKIKFTLKGDFTHNNDCLRRSENTGKSTPSIIIYRSEGGFYQLQDYFYADIETITNNQIVTNNIYGFASGRWNVGVNYCSEKTTGGKCDSFRTMQSDVEILVAAASGAVIPTLPAPTVAPAGESCNKDGEEAACEDPALGVRTCESGVWSPCDTTQYYCPSILGQMDMNEFYSKLEITKAANGELRAAIKDPILANCTRVNNDTGKYFIKIDGKDRDLQFNTDRDGSTNNYLFYADPKSFWTFVYDELLVSPDPAVKKTWKTEYWYCDGAADKDKCLSNNYLKTDIAMDIDTMKTYFGTFLTVFGIPLPAQLVLPVGFEPGTDCYDDAPTACYDKVQDKPGTQDCVARSWQECNLSQYFCPSILAQMDLPTFFSKLEISDNPVNPSEKMFKITDPILAQCTRINNGDVSKGTGRPFIQIGDKTGEKLSFYTEKDGLFYVNLTEFVSFYSNVINNSSYKDALTLYYWYCDGAADAAKCLSGNYIPEGLVTVDPSLVRYAVNGLVAAYTSGTLAPPPVVSPAVPTVRAAVPTLPTATLIPTVLPTLPPAVVSPVVTFPPVPKGVDCQTITSSWTIGSIDKYEEGGKVGFIINSQNINPFTQIENCGIKNYVAGGQTLVTIQMSDNPNPRYFDAERIKKNGKYDEKMIKLPVDKYDDGEYHFTFNIGVCDGTDVTDGQCPGGPINTISRTVMFRIGTPPIPTATVAVGAPKPAAATATKAVPKPDEAGTDCSHVTADWEISEVVPAAFTAGGKTSVTLKGNFGKIANCGMQKWYSQEMPLIDAYEYDFDGVDKNNHFTFKIGNDIPLSDLNDGTIKLPETKYDPAGKWWFYVNYCKDENVKNGQCQVDYDHATGFVGDISKEAKTTYDCPNILDTLTPDQLLNDKLSSWWESGTNRLLVNITDPILRNCTKIGKDDPFISVFERKADGSDNKDPDAPKLRIYTDKDGYGFVDDADIFPFAEYVYNTLASGTDQKLNLHYKYCAGLADSKACLTDGNYTDKKFELTQLADLSKFLKDANIILPKLIPLPTGYPVGSRCGLEGEAAPCYENKLPGVQTCVPSRTSSEDKFIWGSCNTARRYCPSITNSLKFENIVTALKFTVNPVSGGMQAQIEDEALANCTKVTTDLKADPFDRNDPYIQLEEKGNPDLKLRFYTRKFDDGKYYFYTDENDLKSFQKVVFDPTFTSDIYLNYWYCDGVATQKECTAKYKTDSYYLPTATIKSIINGYLKSAGIDFGEPPKGFVPYTACDIPDQVQPCMDSKGNPGTQYCSALSWSECNTAQYYCPSIISSFGVGRLFTEKFYSKWNTDGGRYRLDAGFNDPILTQCTRVGKDTPYITIDGGEGAVLNFYTAKEGSFYYNEQEFQNFMFRILQPSFTNVLYMHYWYCDEVADIDGCKGKYIDAFNYEEGKAAGLSKDNILALLSYLKIPAASLTPVPAASAPAATGVDCSSIAGKWTWTDVIPLYDTVPGKVGLLIKGNFFSQKECLLSGNNFMETKGVTKDSRHYPNGNRVAQIGSVSLQSKPGLSTYIEYLWDGIVERSDTAIKFFPLDVPDGTYNLLVNYCDFDNVTGDKRCDEYPGADFGIVPDAPQVTIVNTVPAAPTAAAAVPAVPPVTAQDIDCVKEYAGKKPIEILSGKFILDPIDPAKIATDPIRGKIVDDTLQRCSVKATSDLIKIHLLDAGGKRTNAITFSQDDKGDAVLNESTDFLKRLALLPFKDVFMDPNNNSNLEIEYQYCNGTADKDGKCSDGDTITSQKITAKEMRDLMNAPPAGAPAAPTVAPTLTTAPAAPKTAEINCKAVMKDYSTEKSILGKLLKADSTKTPPVIDINPALTDVKKCLRSTTADKLIPENRALVLIYTNPNDLTDQQLVNYYLVDEKGLTVSDDQVKRAGRLMGMGKNGSLNAGLNFNFYTCNGKIIDDKCNSETSVDYPASADIALSKEALKDFLNGK